MGKKADSTIMKLYMVELLPLTMLFLLWLMSILSITKQHLTEEHCIMVKLLQIGLIFILKAMKLHLSEKHISSLMIRGFVVLTLISTRINLRRGAILHVPLSNFNVCVDIYIMFLLIY